jgi:putative FmdB family regulatory protein
MPLYEYQCDACGHRFERIQKFSDAPVETCPKCGGAVHKLISSPAIQFKGTGWYVTDYARSGSSGGKGSSASGGAAAEKTESKADETKSAEKKSDASPPAKSDK